jgi:hypothetical protein
MADEGDEDSDEYAEGAEGGQVRRPRSAVHHRLLNPLIDESGQ